MAAPTIRFDLPSPNNETQPFWDGCREGRLMIQRCRACQHQYFYPRPFCPECWSQDVEWFAASGKATLYTYSVVHVNDLPPWGPRVPYIAAIVDLDEGPRMMSIVVDCELADAQIGMALEVTFEERTEEVTVPVFRPAGAKSKG